MPFLEWKDKNTGGVWPRVKVGQGCNKKELSMMIELYFWRSDIQQWQVTGGWKGTKLPPEMYYGWPLWIKCPAPSITWKSAVRMSWGKPFTWGPSHVDDVKLWTAACKRK
jgi:hypothetical protein